jgi:hypothetical protein
MQGRHGDAAQAVQAQTRISAEVAQARFVERGPAKNAARAQDARRFPEYGREGHPIQMV